MEAAAALIAESRSLSWHATRAVRGSGSGERSGGDPLWAFLRRITFGVKEFQRPWVFGGVFASFCRRGQKDVAPEANMQDAGAARNRRTKNGPSGRQPLRGARPKPRETTRARGAEYLFYILPQKHKRLQRKVSFSRRGSLYLDRRRVSAPLPAACYQLSCVLYWATIRQIGSWRDRFL